MNEETRNRILEYNKKRQQYKTAYDDLMKIVEPLFKFMDRLPNYLLKLFPSIISEIIEKYRKEVAK